VSLRAVFLEWMERLRKCIATNEEYLEYLKINMSGRRALFALWRDAHVCVNLPCISSPDSFQSELSPSLSSMTADQTCTDHFECTQSRIIVLSILECHTFELCHCCTARKAPFLSAMTLDIDKRSTHHSSSPHFRSIYGRHNPITKHKNISPTQLESVQRIVSIRL
jgi:hypothetical protein